MPEKDDWPTPGLGGEDEPVEIDVPLPSVTPGDLAPVVMVIDDDTEIRTMLVRALGLTHTVYEASNGEDARAMLDVIPVPDAIVCDVMMPKLDGLGLAKSLRQDNALRRVPILFLTAREGPLDVVAGINAGAKHYVTKPFKVADVVAKVKAMTEKTRR
ncbi:MAG TPA: response regulator [Polyangiaceae bacterium]|jgi:DNA-binding response OmpR family regulator